MFCCKRGLTFVKGFFLLNFDDYVAVFFHSVNGMRRIDCFPSVESSSNSRNKSHWSLYSLFIVMLNLMCWRLVQDFCSIFIGENALYFSFLAESSSSFGFRLMLASQCMLGGVLFNFLEEFEKGLCYFIFKCLIEFTSQKI